MKTILVLILTIVFLISCSTNHSSTLDSDEFNDTSERIEQLEKEIKLFSPILNAEFELFNVNGFSDQTTLFPSVPGASSWDYKFVIKVSADSVNNWIADMDKVDSVVTENWTEKIIEKRKQNWILNSKPEYYRRKNDDVLIILYRKEGVVFKRIVNL